MELSRGGGIGRREGLKSPCQPTDVGVRVPPSAQQRSVAQLVERRVWDAEVLGSNPSTPTNIL